MRDLPLIVAEMPIGQAADVTVWRGNQELSLRPVIGEMPDGAPIDDPGQDQNQAPRATEDIASGLKLAALTAEMRQRLRVPANVSGVVVTAIGNDSPLAGLDLLPGDVIETINQQSVVSPAGAFAKLRSAAEPGRNVILVLINRHGSNRFSALSLEENPRS